MKVEYDSQVDAAYFSLVALSPGMAKRTYACDPAEVGGQIQLDFDDAGRLIGIEVLEASRMLPKEALSVAPTS